MGLTGPVHCAWPGALPASLPPSVALDAGTREVSEAAACAAMARLAPALSDAGIPFKKVDSLIRGHALPELAACMGAGPWRRAVLAPAFPFQDRVTRGGRQWRREADGWAPAGPALVPALRALGLQAQAGQAGTGPGPGVSVYDAESDADLDAVVAGIAGPVLWCGTGGLARALARGRVPPEPPRPGPVLGLFGSDQSATAAQLAACHPHWTALPHGGPPGVAALATRMARHGVAFASLSLPPGLSRADAAARIGSELGRLALALPRPGTLVVAGGETLRGLCTALGAGSLLVQGRALPGVPVSTLGGGRWDGVSVLSKSGAFGPPGLLRDLFPDLLPDLLPPGGGPGRMPP